MSNTPNFVDVMQLGPRVKTFTGNRSKPIRGWAWCCSYGPRGGRYVHILTTGTKQWIRRSVNSVKYIT